MNVNKEIKKGEFENLKKKHEEEIEQLQNKCKHDKKKWMLEWWAIGHSTGYDVLVCLNCNKNIKHRPGKIELFAKKKKVVK